jgi:glycosyltransferase involved in cell wall biosynthesis
MRVTHIITRLIVGGAQENTVASVLGLRRRSGLQVELITGPTEGCEGSLEAAFSGRTSTLLHSPHLIRAVNPWHDTLALRDLTRQLRRLKPDIVHTHSSKAGILGRLAARRAGVPIVVHTIHGPSFGAFQRAGANALFMAAERFAARHTTHFVSVAEAMTRQFLAAGIGRPEQFTRVFSGFELEPFQKAWNDPALRNRLGLASDDIVVGKVARLFELKGHDDLIDEAPAIVAACPRIKFLLVGDGSWRKRLEERVRSLSLERHFIFTGLVPPSEVASLVGVMDMLVHLSRREGLPRALSQALAAARPVAAYDCDGAGEVCFDGETGFLVPTGNRAKLRDAILHLANDAGLRERFGQKGQAFVRERFSVERMVSDLHALYLRLEHERVMKAPR